jgi:hypothetical protein
MSMKNHCSSPDTNRTAGKQESGARDESQEYMSGENGEHISDKGKDIRRPNRARETDHQHKIRLLPKIMAEPTGERDNSWR